MAEILKHRNRGLRFISSIINMTQRDATVVHNFVTDSE